MTWRIVTCRDSDAPVVQQFLAGWWPEALNRTQAAMLLACVTEDEGLRLDCEPEELANCFDSLRREGFTNSLKRVSTGDHFYRSGTGKCPRCYRYRPEIHWNAENIPVDCPDARLCDRCVNAIGKPIHELDPTTGR